MDFSLMRCETPTRSATEEARLPARAHRAILVPDTLQQRGRGTAVRPCVATVLRRLGAQCPP
jgi:hypothetical protein